MGDVGLAASVRKNEIIRCVTVKIFQLFYLLVWRCRDILFLMTKVVTFDDEYDTTHKVYQRRQIYLLNRLQSLDCHGAVVMSQRMNSKRL